MPPIQTARSPSIPTPDPAPAPVSNPIQSLRQRCDEHLSRVLHAGSGVPPRLLDAMGHGVMAGGKRLRPLLVYGAGQACGAPLDHLDAAAVAIELVHAYSLVHDDLPAMDDDDLRRGQPTVHKAYDEATAILAGDALQALAFEVITRGVDAGASADVVLAQCRELARAAGAAGMAGGQALDLAMVGQSPDLDSLSHMHSLKTGALIQAAVRLGALAGDAGPTQQARLDRYGADIGLAFQIQDDVLDEIGDVAVTGKAVGADRERGKPTYTALLGVEAAQARAQELLARALKALEGLPGDSTLLRAVALQLVNRQH
jgi:geranylgeranyl diphosphate synthase type II